MLTFLFGFQGKKFNARKETVQDDEYFGIRIFRFYIRCPRCLAEITFKTNPKEADYDLEHGATRNFQVCICQRCFDRVGILIAPLLSGGSAPNLLSYFQALQTAEKLAEAQRVAEEEDDKANPMKMLEKRTAQSLLEMEKIEALEELKELNERQATVDIEGMLSKNLQQQKETAEQRHLREEKEIQDEVEAIFKEKGIEKVNGVRIKRIKDVDVEEEERRLMKRLKSDPLKTAPSDPSSSQLNKLKSLIRIKKVEEAAKSTPSTSEAAAISKPGGSGLGLLADYGNSDEDSS